MMAAQKLTMTPFDTNGLRGSLKFDEPMSRHTSWRVGGPAEYFYTPADCDDVIELVKRVPTEVPITWLGLGSNLLVRDGGVQGLVIRTVKALTRIELRDDNQLYAEAGVTSSKVARTSIAANLSGAEFLAGVPGSFGGALAMNAGAFGGETWPLVVQVTVIDRAGKLRTLHNDEVRWSYRSVQLPEDAALLSGVLQLKSAEANTGKAEIRSLLERRAESQPVQSANAGSVFKNPEGGFAAKIVQQIGLKGHVIGGACFSEKHANFIINQGAATAWDIEQLIALAQQQAMSQLGVQLETEVRTVGTRI